MSSLDDLVPAEWLVIGCAVAMVLLLGGHRVAGGGWGLSGWRGHRLAVVVTTAGAVLTLVVPSGGVLVAIGAGAALGAGWLVSRRRAYSRARDTSQEVQAICADLADDLRMGRAPRDALNAAARRWHGLQPAAVAAELHHDVHRALRDVALTPGADGLHDVAAAWQMSVQTGSGLADAVGQVARLLGARERRARMVDAELAAARATAVIVAGLPVLVLTLGVGLGTHPWLFFLHGPGPLVLALGMALLLGGWAWIESLAHRMQRIP